MSLSLFIARRLSRREQGERRVSRPAVLIAKLGIAVGLAVMLIAISVVVGFKSEVRDKIVGMGGHIQVVNRQQMQPYEALPVGVNDALVDQLVGLPRVKHVQRFAYKPGLVKTADAFQGMVLKGVGADYDTCFLHHSLIAGQLPAFSSDSSSQSVVVSQALVEKLNLELGDKLDTYYIEDEVRARRLKVVGIYRTNFSEYDDLFLFTDLYTVNRLNRWDVDQVGGLEVILDDYVALDDATWEISSLLEGRTDAYGAGYSVRNVELLYPAIFSWLDILDVNIWVILVLMMGVAGFTMISGLIILIIERTPMIGTLKALGADNSTIQRVFLWFSAFLIGRGMLWGNVVGIGICLVQQATGIFTLDAETYYMDTVPMVIHPVYWLLLNVGTLILSVLILVGPSCLIAYVRPADSIRYE